MSFMSGIRESWRWKKASLMADPVARDHGARGEADQQHEQGEDEARRPRPGCCQLS